jgi:hypothetical protein
MAYAIKHLDSQPYARAFFFCEVPASVGVALIYYSKYMKLLIIALDPTLSFLFCFPDPTKASLKKRPNPSPASILQNARWDGSGRLFFFAFHFFLPFS